MAHVNGVLVHCRQNVCDRLTLSKATAGWNDLLASIICFNELYKIDVYGIIMHDAYSALMH